MLHQWGGGNFSRSLLPKWAQSEPLERLVASLTPGLPGDFGCFLSTATGYGTVGVENGKAFFTTVAGNVEIREIKFTRHD